MEKVLREEEEEDVTRAREYAKLRRKYKARPETDKGKEKDWEEDILNSGANSGEMAAERKRRNTQLRHAWTVKSTQDKEDARTIWRATYKTTKQWPGY